MCVSNLFKKSRRRSFYVHCPMCGKLLDKSEREESVRVCERCKTETRITLIPGVLLMKFKSMKLRSPEYDGKPIHDRRIHEPAFCLLEEY